jgi:hypothetical protein
VDQLALNLEAAYSELLDRKSRQLEPGSPAEQRSLGIFALLEKGFNPPLVMRMGSLINGTGVAWSDLDLFVEFEKDLVQSRNPDEMLSILRDYLGIYYKCEVDGQAVRVIFDTFPDLDVVPAFAPDKERHYFFIPDVNSNRWIVVDPIGHMMKMKKVDPIRKELIRILKLWNASAPFSLISYYIDLLGITVDVSPDTPMPDGVCEIFGHARRCLEKSLTDVDADIPESKKYPKRGVINSDIVEVVLGYKPYSIFEIGKSLETKECLVLNESILGAERHLERSRDYWTQNRHEESIEEAGRVFGRSFPGFG